MSNNTAYGTQDNYVWIPDDPSQAPTKAELTLEGWFTITPGSAPQTYAAIIFKSTKNMQDGYGLYWYSGSLYFWINNLNIRVGIPASAIGDSTKFHHVVGVYNGSNISIYLDGAPFGDPRPLAASEGLNKPVNASHGALQIGKGWGWSWGGRLDEVAVYNYALPASNIQKHFQAVRPPGPLSREFVAYAQQSLTFGTGDQVTGGDVGVASLSSQTANAQLVIGDSDVFDSQRGVFAPSVSVGSQTQVGTISTNVLNGTAASPPSFPTSMPLLPLVPSGAPGTTNVTVAAGRTQTLNPGVYGALVVNGTATLRQGSYSFSSITVGAGGAIVALQFGNTTIRVDSTLTTGTGAVIYQQSQAAGSLVISVAGADSSPSAPAVSIGANSALFAVLNAPRGTVAVADGCSVAGAVSAFAINVGNNVTMKLDPAATAVGDAPVGQQKLTGYVTPEMAAAPLVGPVPRSTTVFLSVSLPVRTATGCQTLHDLARQVSDPTNSLFRHFISDTDYNNCYKPTYNDYQALTSFAQSAGLSIANSYDDQELLDVSGPVAVVEAALHSNMNLYLRADGTTFHALDRDPSINLDINTPVLRISGTTNFRAARPAFNVPGATFFGNNFRNMYVSQCTTGPGALDGTGQSIAILVLEGFDWKDILIYDSNAGIPDPPNMAVGTWDGTGRFIQTQDPTAPFVDWFDPIGSPNGAVEAPSDIELAHAMAPGANIVVYQANNADGAGIIHDYQVDTVHAAAHPPMGQRSYQVSTSWSMTEDDGLRQNIDVMAAFGQSFVVTSGDGGSSTTNPVDIRMYDNVTIVGGTQISMFGGASPVEAALADGTVTGGGGYMAPFGLGGPGSGDPETGVDIPWYQSTLGGFIVNSGNFASSRYRNYPDVSMVGTNIGSIITSGGSPGSISPFDGTSASGPLFAGFLALVNQKSVRDGGAPVGFANPALYMISATVPGAFNDIQMGSIPTGGRDPIPSSGLYTIPAGGFPATPGYDLATGLGSPSCALLNQLASATPTVPVSNPTPPLSPFPQAVALGSENSCMIADGTSVQCWGLNKNGEAGPWLPTGVNTDQHLKPVCSNLPSEATGKAIAAGTGHSCAILSDSSVWCWGFNDFGQLGPAAVDSATGLPLQKSSAVQVQGLPNGDPPVQIVAGGSDTCVTLASGTLWCWGSNQTGILGTGTADNLAHPIPSMVQNVQPVVQASIGPLGSYMCAVLSPGFVSCWGTFNTSGVLGPQQVQLDGQLQPVSNAVFVSAGDNHSCLILRAVGSDPGGLFCWGSNVEGQLGTGTATPTITNSGAAIKATAVPNQLSSVACGTSSTCALTGDGTVLCWGANDRGQVGIGNTSESQLNPVPVFANAVALYSGWARVCAQPSSGPLSCWGAEPIGNDTTSDSSSPTQVPFAHCVPSP
jgi:alpha-tubulin suppressor-like RCC1 family protein